VAVPLTADGAVDGARGAQAVHAYLPVRSYGLRVALHGEWNLASGQSRAIPCNVRRERGQSLVLLEGREGSPL